MEKIDVDKLVGDARTILEARIVMLEAAIDETEAQGKGSLTITYSFAPNKEFANQLDVLVTSSAKLPTPEISRKAKLEGGQLILL